MIAVIMAEFKQKKRNSFWHSPIFLFFLFCFLGVFIYNTFGLIKKVRETEKNKNLVLSKIDELKEKEDFYKTEIEVLDTEIGLEELARSKFQVSKPGEKVVSIIEEDVSLENQENLKRKTFWSWIIDLF
jgi:cell division protein FtsB